MPESSVAKPHDIAAGEVSCWRGRCLDLFARAERCVSLTLEAASQSDSRFKVRHLAGHRLEDLAKFAGDPAHNNEKQVRSLSGLIERWKEVDAQRPYLSHGVATVLLDRHGQWHVQLDFNKYSSKGIERLRWTASRDEASEFEGRLDREYKLLSAQVGQLRKRLAP